MIECADLRLRHSHQVSDEVVTVCVHLLSHQNGPATSLNHLPSLLSPSMGYWWTDITTAASVRCRIPVFVELAGRIVRHRDVIDAALDHGLSQRLIESTNTKIRLLTRIAFGFRSPEALIALAMLALGGHRPSLPGRTRHPRISQ